MMLLKLQFFIFLAALSATCLGEIMNNGGIPYAISTAQGPGVYSTDFEHNVEGPVDHFDVYGEVQTRYSQVYWTRNTPITLPPQIVERFRGKVMAITGYEVDQVVHDGPKPNPTGSAGNLGGFSCYPSCGNDSSVPIYHAYNHHYFSWLASNDVELYKLEKPTKKPNPTFTGLRDRPHDYVYPTNIVFKENPGGEYRKSYHGYPSGYAQLIQSPTQWIVEPMQIDTHNRKYKLTDRPGYHEAFLPQQSSGVVTEKNSLSPLIECPCSTRISKKVVNDSAAIVSGVCKKAIESLAECAAAVGAMSRVSASTSVSDPALPGGCIMVPAKPTAPGVEPSFSALFNTAPAPARSCAIREGVPAGADAALLQGTASLAGLTTLQLSSDGAMINITFSGPDGSWFGVGFDAQRMADEPYAIIVDGNGSVSERKLANHAPGTLLRPSVHVVSSVAINGTRIVTLTRPVQGAGGDYWSFPKQAGEVKVITAIGSTPTISYHKARSPASIFLVHTEVPSCVCAPSQTTYIWYMNKTEELYATDCADEPRSDMLRHGDGTGRNVSNAACSMLTYHGGLRCCLNSWFLTDVEQDHLIPEEVDTYYLKWRYYFQEYVPAKLPASSMALSLPHVQPTQPASHRHLHHWVFLIDLDVNDYEEDNAHYGTASLGKIEAHLPGSQIGLEDIPSHFSPTTNLTFYVMTPHCHAPNCIREELWNVDTGELICSVTAEYGSPKYGSTDAPFNEKDYIALPPCIFGHQAGLKTPPTILPSTNLRAVKYFNNTYRHLGQMAQWTGLMKYGTDPY